MARGDFVIGKGERLLQVPASGLDKKMLSELHVAGFVHPRAAHLHLFKHVVRICDLPSEELSANRDPEEWEEILPNPPLVPDLHARRRIARRKLAEIDSCGLGPGRSREVLPCRSCSNADALRAVDQAFSDVLSAYLGAAREALDWAKRNASEKLPFLIAFRRSRGSDISVKFVDKRRVVGAGLLGGPRGSVFLLTCYRSTPARSLQSLKLEFCRERAGLRAAGALVPILNS